MKKIWILAIALFMASISKQTNAQEIINTIAGNGTDGYSGDGGPAVDAQFIGPASIAVDTSGNLYIADYGNNRIRKVTYATGIITTIAGTGYLAVSDSGAYSGDGGPATAADLYNPVGIALGPSGNIYFSDQSNNRVRMINASTGAITTVAGNGYGAPVTGAYSGDSGQATAAELFFPAGITFDTAGDLYIADWKNNRIRKVTMSTGIITTIAGTGVAGYSGDGGPGTAARLYIPSDVAFDVSGNLYISEYGNSTVRKVTASAGIISTIAGTGVAGYSGDGSAGTSAKVNRPLAVTTDTAGNVYVADWENFRVRMISGSTGIISTIAGDGTNGYMGDGGPATSAELSAVDGITIDVRGNLYISDEFNSVIREVSCSTCYPASVPVIKNTPVITIYPNPSTGKFTIQADDNQPYNLAVYNAVGERVYQSQMTAKCEIDLTNQPAGVYFLQMQSAVKSVIVKLLIYH